MNFKKSMVAFLIISMFMLSSCEVYQTLYGKAPEKQNPLNPAINNSESTQVVRVEGDTARDPATLSKTVYSSSEPVAHDPFKLGENPLGPYPIGKSLGLTLSQWLSASGIGVYSVNKNSSDLELSFKNLVPNSAYTVWCSRLTLPPDAKIEDKPCGADDGSQDGFTSDAKGSAAFSLNSMPLEASTNVTKTLIAVAYHSDGKTYGASPGDFGKTTHVQVFFMMPEPKGNSSVFEVPIKFTNHIDAGMPEQDVFIEKEVEAKNETPVQEMPVSENTTSGQTQTEQPSVTGEIIQSGGARPAQGQGQEKPVVIDVMETEKVNLAPKAEDPDKNTNLVFTFTSPLNDKGEWQTNYGDAGQYTVTVTASDGELTTSRDVLIIVNKKEEAPTIDSAKPIESGLKINENQAIEFAVTASDKNKDPLTYSWKLDGKEVGNSDKFTYNSDYDSAGTHTVKVEISDGVNTASKIWSIDVANVNRPPQLEPINDIHSKETDKIVINAIAADADNDQVNYSISDKRFVQDNNVFTWQTDYDSAGTYNVTIQATDGKDTVSRSFKVVVDNVNRPPVIIDIEQKK